MEQVPLLADLPQERDSSVVWPGSNSVSPFASLPLLVELHPVRGFGHELLLLGRHAGGLHA